MRLRYGLIIALILPLLLSTGRKMHAAQDGVRRIRFSGYEWEVKEGASFGPGPNRWDADNVRVDDNGWLHLKISRVQGVWRCAELTSRKRFGFGRYQFQVAGPLDRLDPSIVLGLFDYTTPDVGPDGTNEIDIEFARWADPQAPPGNFTVYPVSGKAPATNHYTFRFSDPKDLTTHRFVRTADRVTFQSLRGHRDDEGSEIAHWSFAPNDARLIPQQPIPVHLNLWLFQGKPPTDQKEVEIVIRQFTFIPGDLLPASQP